LEPSIDRWPLSRHAVGRPGSSAPMIAARRRWTRRRFAGRLWRY